MKDNIERKQRDTEKMQRVMVEYTKEITKEQLEQTKRISTPYAAEIDLLLPDWREFTIEGFKPACAG